MITALKGAAFEKEIKEAGLVIVQFRTEWNGGCQIIAPIYEMLSKQFASEATFFTIDTEEEKAIADKYRIKELPAILIFKTGELIDHIAGLKPKNVLRKKIEDAIAGDTI